MHRRRKCRRTGYALQDALIQTDDARGGKDREQRLPPSSKTRVAERATSTADGNIEIFAKVNYNGPLALSQNDGVIQWHQGFSLLLIRSVEVGYEDNNK